MFYKLLGCWFLSISKLPDCILTKFREEACPCSPFQLLSHRISAPERGTARCAHCASASASRSWLDWSCSILHSSTETCWQASSRGIQKSSWVTDIETSRPEGWPNDCCGWSLSLQPGCPHVWTEIQDRVGFGVTEFGKRAVQGRG